MSGKSPSKLPWSGSLSVDLSRGALSVSADGLAVIDAQHVCWAIVFPDVYGGYDHAANLVDAVNSHAINEAKIEALTEALKGMLFIYVELVESGDAGFWDVEKVHEVIAARTALASAQDSEG